MNNPIVTCPICYKEFKKETTGQKYCNDCRQNRKKEIKQYQNKHFHNWWEQPLVECPICGKKFAPAVEHAWKINDVPDGRLVCSYHCMRAWERKWV